MPDYKIIDSGKLDYDLTRIADVIREKSGVTVKLDFPGAYINVLNGLLTRIPMSEGLEYVLNDDRAGYTVTGLGTCTDTDIIIPPIYEGLAVVSIGDNAFEGCSEITSVAIPDSVESIGADAFGGCSALKSIAIPAGVTRIGNYPFWGCPGIKSITVNSQNTVYHSAGNCLIETASKTLIQGCQNSVIPDDGSVTSIGDDAFDDCTYLKSIVIPKSVTSIGRWAFKNCVELTDITIPDSVTSIGQSAFKNCTKLSSAIIGNGVTSIGDWAFSLCPALTSVTIGNNVTSIGLGAFFNCSGLTSVTIPDSVTSIGDNAFNGCTNLSVIIMTSDTPPTIYSNTFSNNLSKIIVPAGCGDTYKPEDNWKTYENIIFENILEFTPLAGGTGYSVTGLGNCIDTDIIIPSMYEGLPVKSIGNSAFKDCSGITSVTIPDSVESIGYSAFYGCSSLKSITLPFIGAYKGNGFYSHFGYIFGAPNYNSNGSFVPSSLKNVIITGGKSIGDYAFYGCSGLTSITIPDGIYSIYSFAFKYCSNLTHINIPDSLKIIGSAVFDGCSKLQYTVYDNCRYLGSSNNPYVVCIGAVNKSITSCNIHENAILIYYCAFSICTNLKSVTIPDTVESINYKAFYNCYSLSNITIPKRVVYLDAESFGNLGGSGGATVTMLCENPPSIQLSTFIGVALYQITVPKGCVNNYKLATNWSNYAEYIVEATA